MQWPFKSSICWRRWDCKSESHLRQQMVLLKCHCTFFIYGALSKKAFCQILKRWFISWITGQIVQKLQILLFFVSYIASILKGKKCSTYLVWLSKYTHFGSSYASQLVEYKVGLDILLSWSLLNSVLWQT